ncbi:MAG: hypothetical protein DMG70_05020 [Acidobacteria bacterium]|nr:MAG: hypothetical protein DMG70_05020 [Acidobacteriota bacterium]
MEIDPHNLPAEAKILQQIVLQLLQAVEDKDQLLARLQHQLAQLLRYFPTQAPPQLSLPMERRTWKVAPLSDVLIVTRRVNL